MKTKRLLIALAAVLLSCGITNAQQTEGNNVNEDKQSDVEVKAVQGDANKDGVVNAADVPVLADSIITDKLSDLERLDLNEDQKVNAADVTLLIKKIQDTNYFWMGTVKPTSTDYSTKEDVIRISTMWLFRTRQTEQYTHYKRMSRTLLSSIFTKRRKRL